MNKLERELLMAIGSAVGELVRVTCKDGKFYEEYIREALADIRELEGIERRWKENRLDSDLK
jgi:hypothetical protein